MRLRRHILMRLAASYLGLAVVLGASITYISLHRLRQLENASVSRNTARALNALDAATGELASRSADWGAWSATYEFMGGTAPGYLQENLAFDSFEVLNIDAMVFVRPDGRVAASFAPDHVHHRLVPVNREILAALTAAGGPAIGIPGKTVRTGALSCRDGAIIFAAHPILTSEGAGPARGAIVFARRLDAAMCGDISAQSHVSMSIHELTAIDVPASVRKALPGRHDALAVVPHVLDHGRLAGYAYYPDWKGAPAVIVAVTESREMWKQGVDGLRLQVLAMLVALLALGLVVRSQLDRRVFRRLADLATQAHTIAQSGQFTAEIALTGTDEIADFASSVNVMLRSLASAHRHLGESETLLRAFFDGGNLMRGILEWNISESALRYVLYNDCLGAFIAPIAVALPADWPDGETPARPPLHLDGPEGDTWLIMVRRARDTRSAVAFEFTRGEGDTWQVLSARLYPISDASVPHPRFACMIEDVTDRRRAEADLRHARDAADAANRAKSEFLATMSHEIRTPMNGVMGMASFLLETPLSDEQREYAQTISASSEALLTILNDVLDFSKIEAGRMAIDELPFDLSVACRDVCGLMMPRAAEKHLDLSLHFPPWVPAQVIGDAGRVRQVLLNLLGNALKFTERGHVSLDVSGSTTPDGNAALVLRVTDTGIGISATAQAALFQPFTQADASTSRRYGGTGLGLAISRRLVELMHGTLGVDSTPGEGSTFWISLRLPLAPFASPVTPVPELDGVRILVADRARANQAALREWLVAWGARVEEAATWDDAYDRLCASAVAGAPFHLALLDARLRGDDSAAMGRLLREEPDIARTRLFLLGSHTATQEREHLVEAGIDGWITRPWNAARLRGVLVAALTLDTPGFLTLEGLAASDAMPIAPARPAEPTELPARPLRVLVVEDNRVNQLVAARMLRQCGCEVSLASDGADGVAEYIAGGFDMIFMDCQMPGLDGYGATRQIRAIEARTRRTPIIALTANALAGDREVCLEAGMDDFLAKPVRLDEIRAMLERWGAEDHVKHAA